MSNFALAIMAIASMAIPFVNDALGADCTLPAWPQDASGTINTCINNLPTAGGVVTLPAGKYAIANTINMGDGTDSMESTRFAVSLIGAGDGVSSQESGNANAADSGTKLQAINSFTGPMLKVRGPTLNMRIEGIHFNGGGTASGLEIIHSSRSKFERVTVSNYTGLAYSLNTRNTTSIAYGNCNILMLNVNALSPATSTASGMKLDGYQVSGGKDTCGVVAIGGILWYGGGTGSSGIELAFTDSNQFKRIAISCAGSSSCNYSGGVGIRFSQPTHDSGFPYGNAFDEVYYNQGIGGTSGTRGNWFTNLPTSEGVSIPYNFANVRGITDKGELFGPLDMVNAGSSYTAPTMYVGERNGSHNGAGVIVFKREQPGVQERARVRSEYFEGLVFGTTAGETSLTDRWRIEPGGKLLPFAANTYDIGSSSSAVHNLYIGGSIYANGASGMSRSVTIGSCTITFTGGIATSSTCP